VARLFGRSPYDTFSPLGSRFDGCIQSGEAAAKELLDALGK
jgi:hypothetical protein